MAEIDGSGRITTLLCIILLLPTLALANGGPVDGSSIVSTGNIVLEGVDGIRLEKEELTFEIDLDWVDVEAVYSLVNEGDATRVTYAFPVEYSPLQWLRDDRGWASGDIPYFHLHHGDRELEVGVVTEPDSFLRTGPEGWEITCWRRWYVTELEFDPGETMILRVEYRFKPYFEDFMTNKDFYLSCSDRMFSYDLSPAAGWGDGNVSEFGCTIDFGPLIRNMGSVVTVPEGGSWLSDSLYRVEAEDLDPATAGNLDVAWNAVIWKVSEHLCDNRVPLARITTLEASSELPPQGEADYGVGNLLDLDLSTAWVEGAASDGTGEWVEMVLHDFSVIQIDIVSGYVKSESAYLENSRPRRIEYEIIMDPEGTKFGYSLADTLRGAAILEDLEWQPVNRSSLFTMVQTVTRVGQNGGPVGNLRLRVTDVYPGTLYDDMCITELLILGYTNEEIASW